MTHRTHSVGIKWRYHIFLSLPAASRRHNREYPSVCSSLTVSPAYTCGTGCSSNAVGKRNKNPALKEIRRLEREVA